MFSIGCHLSVSKGMYRMGQDALSIGATTFQFFTRNPRGGSAREIDPDDFAALRTLMTENGFAPVIAHAPYTLNPCARDERLREFACETMCDDLKRLSLLPDALYNFHPGSHVGQGVQEGIALTAALLRRVLETKSADVSRKSATFSICAATIRKQAFVWIPAMSGRPATTSSTGWMTCWKLSTRSSGFRACMPFISTTA